MQEWWRVKSEVSSWLHFGSNIFFIIFTYSVAFSYVLGCFGIVGTEF